MLVDEFLKVLLILKEQLLFGTGLLKHSHIEYVAVLAPVLIAWRRTVLLLFREHVPQTMKLLYRFLGRRTAITVLRPLLRLVHLLYFLARAIGK